MNLKIVIDEEKLKELVAQAAENIKAQLCEDCPYREERDSNDLQHR